jgi:hypothetical protein
VNPALVNAKNSVTQAQAEVNQAKMEALQGQKDLIERRLELANAQAATKDAQYEKCQAELDIPKWQKKVDLLAELAKKFEKEKVQEDKSFKDLQKAAEDELQAAKNKVKDAEHKETCAKEKVTSAQAAVHKAEGVSECLQKDQQKAESKLQQAIQSLLNQVQATPASTAGATTKVAADATPNLLLLASALTPMTIGCSGTLIGQTYAEGPIGVPCLEAPCPLRIPYARSKSLCGCSLVAPIAGSSLPATGPGFDSMELPAAEWPAMPSAAPARGHHLHKRLSTPKLLPTESPDPPPLSGSMPIQGRSSVPTPRVRRASYQREETPDPSSQPAAEMLTPTILAGPAPDPNLARPPLPLPDTPETYRQLRYFGAVAGPTDQKRPGESPTTQRDYPSRDPFAFQPHVTVVPLPPAERVSDGSIGQRNSDLGIELAQDRLVAREGKSVRTYHFDLPARFPVTKFGPMCCAFEGEGAVIHEGMRFLSRQDGRYEVRFNVTAPSMPVVIRLQLVLYEKDGHVPRTLTLPPIVLKPSGLTTFPEDLEAWVDPTSYIVSVTGYSQVVNEVHQPDNTSFLLVKRIGTARFGSGVRYQSTP